MELNRIQDRFKEIHNRPYVKNVEVVALSPLLYLGTLGYFAGSVAVQAVRPFGKKIKSRFEAIDDSSLHSKNTREKRVFDPNPEGVKDFSIPAPSPAHDTEQVLLTSEPENTLDHNQQEGIES